MWQSINKSVCQSSYRLFPLVSLCHGKGFAAPKTSSPWWNRIGEMSEKGFSLKNKQNKGHWLGKPRENVETELQEDVFASVPPGWCWKCQHIKAFCWTPLFGHHSILCAQTPRGCWGFVHAFGTEQPRDLPDSTVVLAKARALQGWEIQVSGLSQLRNRNCGFGHLPSHL